MQVTERIESIRSIILKAKIEGKKIGFVPTMGALHEGHLSLIRRCKNDGNFVVVSIYVNPSQFGPSEDFNRYPRTLQQDLKKCMEEGVDVVFNPTDKEMYPEGFSTWVNVDGITEELCGKFRPGHFRGVTTIVAKLFFIIQPDFAYFGRKDYQQLKVIEKMARELNSPVKIVGCSTVRDYDGIALSSRNNYLSEEERKRARTIPAVLSEANERWLCGKRIISQILEGLRQKLASSVDKIDYFSAYDPETLVEFKAEDKVNVNPLIALAVYIGKTRLIDNLQLGVDKI